MRVLSRRNRFRFLAAALAIAANANISAIPVLEPDSGLLIGAQGVFVGGASYDVEFVKGACSDIFSGCDDPSDFAFSDLDTATRAGQALLDHVFLDNGPQMFDSLPAMTAGCQLDTRGFGAKCHVQTPFTRVMFGELGFRLINVENTGPDHPDLDNITSSPTGDLLTASMDNSAIPNVTWARWTLSPTSVPEPSTLALLSMALAAILFARRTPRAARNLGSH
jgi:hypothetical protein